MPRTDRELRELQAVNDTGRQPVVFIHGLWVLAESWRAWQDLFERAATQPSRLTGPANPVPSRRRGGGRRCSPEDPSARPRTTSHRR